MQIKGDTPKVEGKLETSLSIAKLDPVPHTLFPRNGEKDFKKRKTKNE